MKELLNLAKEAFSSLQMPGGGDLTKLTESQVIVGMQVAQMACSNWDTALNNSYCIRSAIVRNSSIYDYFVDAGFDMSHRPETITCDRFKNLFQLFVYALATNCDDELANATNSVLILSMEAIPNFNLSKCEFYTFEEIMASEPDLGVLTTRQPKITTESPSPSVSTTTSTAATQSVTKISTSPETTSTTPTLTTTSTTSIQKEMSTVTTQPWSTIVSLSPSDEASTTVDPETGGVRHAPKTSGGASLTACLAIICSVTRISLNFL